MSRKVYKPDKENYPAVGAAGSQPKEAGEMKQTTSATVSQIHGDASTEDDVALRFAAMHHNKLRFDHTRGKWFAWDGVRWKLEDTEMVLDLVRNLCRSIRSSIPVKQLASRRMVQAIEAFCRADRRFAVTHKIWNTDPWLLTTPGGTVNLKTGALIANDPANLITKSAAVSPAVMPTPAWDGFLHEATCSDDELILFLQKIAGYCLTGTTHEHKLFFLYGPGGNGKGTFVNALTEIEADYATASNMDAFTESYGDKHPTELARLEAARMVTASETEEGRAWAEARIKQLTGGDMIAARYMRKDFFEYMPQFKLLIQGNHAPRLNNVDDAMRRRFNIIPFVFKPPTPNLHLNEELRAEYPGILKWAIDGCLQWQSEGLDQPQSVVDETENYFSEQDIVAQWLAEKTEVCGSTTHTTHDVLFRSWTQYATRCGEKPGSARNFSQSMERHHFRNGRFGGNRGFFGIRLKALADYDPYQD